MSSNFEDVFAFVFGLCAVLLNKYLAEATVKYVKASTGAETGLWFSRIGFIVVGVFFMLVGIRNC